MSTRRFWPVGSIAIGLAGCTSLSPAQFADGTPPLRPEAFFAGTTSSSGVLENRAGDPTAQLHVEGHGVRLPDGQFRLDQTILLGTDPPRTRTWMLRRVDDHHYEASLTDASGPVHGEVYGNLFHLSYAMKDVPFGRMEQWLYLQPDGHTVVNEATVTILGIVVAHLSERITQQASGPEGSGGKP